MFRLTRQVRFAINDRPDDQLRQEPSNSFGGYPSLTGLGRFLCLELTVAGQVDAQSNYLVNIKQIDQQVRVHSIPLVEQLIAAGRFGGGAGAALALFDQLRQGWGRLSLERLRLRLSPYLSLSVVAREHPMVRLSQKFEFSAAHRLHNPALSDEENRRTYGKCNNPNWHGHNYELEVTLNGEPDASGVLIQVPELERIVSASVIERYDHRNLNTETPEFRELIPSVENIAMTIYRLLKPELAKGSARLASVTVWETPKTWCEYSE